MAWFYREEGISDLQHDFNAPAIRGWIAMKGWIRLVQKYMWAQGMGRHSLQETINFGLGDLRALSAFLGESISVTRVGKVLFLSLSK